jgi:hypothetical protein
MSPEELRVGMRRLSVELYSAEAKRRRRTAFFKQLDRDRPRTNEFRAASRARGVRAA